MRPHPTLVIVLIAALSASVLVAQPQEQDAREMAQERAQAELDAPKIVDVLELKPGMTMADVGSGGGAMTVVLGKWIGTGRVFATDITEHALRWTRQYVKKEGLTNVTVIEGAAAATNLADACCDAALLRHVYHHITEIDAFNKSLYTSLKPGGRLAIIDFVPDKGSRLPAGVPANRGGHGVPTAVVIEEMKAAGFTYERTIDKWPPGDKIQPGFLTLFRK
ncbi:MAG: methyltransferase domain-containing protein [Vicinamibacterales bacterium]